MNLESNVIWYDMDNASIHHNKNWYTPFYINKSRTSNAIVYITILLLLLLVHESDRVPGMYYIMLQLQLVNIMKRKSWETTLLHSEKRYQLWVCTVCIIINHKHIITSETKCVINKYLHCGDCVYHIIYRIKTAYTTTITVCGVIIYLRQ